MEGAKELLEENKVNVIEGYYRRQLTYDDYIFLYKLLNASSKIGVPIRDADGSYRPFLDIIRDWAKVWKECSYD